MLVNELRLGNLVIVDNYGCHEVDTTMLSLIKYGSDLFKPIPLTEEWLLKLGFEKVENTWKRLSLCNDWTYLYWSCQVGLELSVGKHPIMLPRINYAHQLQNLYFALTGEELTLKQ